MLNCPSRSPVSFSNLLAGGILKSFKILELLIIRSFLSAICCMSRGNLFDPPRLYTFSVSLCLNDFIISLLIRDYTILRLTSSVIARNGTSGNRKRAVTAVGCGRGTRAEGVGRGSIVKERGRFTGPPETGSNGPGYVICLGPLTMTVRSL